MLANAKYERVPAHPIAVAEHSTACMLPGPKTNVSYSWFYLAFLERELFQQQLYQCKELDFTSADTLLGGDFLIQRF